MGKKKTRKPRQKPKHQDKYNNKSYNNHNGSLRYHDIVGEEVSEKPKVISLTEFKKKHKKRRHATATAEQIEAIAIEVFGSTKYSQK